jgi:hypothetical protein
MAEITYSADRMDGHTTDPLMGIMQHTPVSRLFFNPRNVDTIQTELRYRVHAKTGILVGPQSHKELMIIMRSIFLQESLNQETNITEQIRILNEKVLEYSVKVVSSNALQQRQYEVDAGTAPIPMSHPVGTSGRNRFTFSLHPEESTMFRDLSMYPSATKPMMR